MSGMTYSVLIRSSFSPADSGRVTTILRNLADKVAGTSKGRHWDCDAHGCAISLDVQSTERHAYDYEELLLQHDLLFDEAPEAFLITCGVRDPQVQEWCNNLAERLTSEFDGINCGFGG